MLHNDYKTIRLHSEGSQLNLTLNQPQVRNAMSLAMVEECIKVLDSLATNQDFHVLVVRGAGGFFSAGADLKDMSEARALLGKSTEDPFFKLNRSFGRMISAFNQIPQTTVAVLEGAALGGGFGLACVSDVAICHQDCWFGLPETGLGVIPAQIAPFVVSRIGITHARRLALTGRRFRGHEALRIGVAHFLAQTDQELESLLQETLQQIKTCAPQANRTTKALLHAVATTPLPVLLDQAAHDFSKAVQGEEAREGMKAFLEKRPPSWSASSKQ